MKSANPVNHYLPLSVVALAVFASPASAKDDDWLETTVEPVSQSLTQFISEGWQIVGTGTATGVTVFLQNDARAIMCRLKEHKEDWKSKCFKLTDDAEP